MYLVCYSLVLNRRPSPVINFQKFFLPEDSNSNPLLQARTQDFKIYTRFVLMEIKKVFVKNQSFRTPTLPLTPHPVYFTPFANYTLVIFPGPPNISCPLLLGAKG